MRRLSENFVDNLVELHAVDWRAAGLADLGKPEGYVGRQVSGWTERYGKARTDDIPEMEQVAEWLAEHMPRPSGADAHPQRLQVRQPGARPRRTSPSIRAVLDWEMATIGDPLTDLGTALAYWVRGERPGGAGGAAVRADDAAGQPDARGAGGALRARRAAGT